MATYHVQPGTYAVPCSGRVGSTAYLAGVGYAAGESVEIRGSPFLACPLVSSPVESGSSRS